MQRLNIIWDWNGTLLNDLTLCISSINKLLGKRNLPLLDLIRYKEVFSFPVKDYYTTIGFDFAKEDFSLPAHEFIDLYESGVGSCTLHPSAIQALDYFRDKGCSQFVLSAMHQDMLMMTLRMHEIDDYFTGIAGLDDHYANSKLERGKWLMEKFHINKEKTYLIGDTIHDNEVACALGVRCVLIADGHQSVNRLKSTGSVVMNNLSDLIESEVLTFTHKK